MRAGKNFESEGGDARAFAENKRRDKRGDDRVGGVMTSGQVNQLGRVNKAETLKTDGDGERDGRLMGKRGRMTGHWGRQELLIHWGLGGRL